MIFSFSGSLVLLLGAAVIIGFGFGILLGYKIALAQFKEAFNLRGEKRK